MFSYAGKTSQEIKEYEERSRKDWNEKYGKRVDENGRWLSQADSSEAIYVDGTTQSITTNSSHTSEK